MTRFELYKEFYREEKERRTKIEDMSNLPIAFSITIATASFFLLTNYQHSSFVAVTIIFLFSLCGTFFYFILAILSLVKSYKGLLDDKDYKSITSIDRIENRFSDLNVSGDRNEIPSELELELTSVYVQSLSNDQKLNDARLNLIHKSKKNLVKTIGFLFFASISFAANKYLSTKSHSTNQSISILECCKRMTPLHNKIDSLNAINTSFMNKNKNNNKEEEEEEDKNNAKDFSNESEIEDSSNLKKSRKLKARNHKEEREDEK